jgi:hypothetical protein
MQRRHKATLARFVLSLGEMPWLAHLGEPHPTAWVVPGISNGWDVWGENMLATWSPRTTELERRALPKLGNPGLETVFERVSAATGPPAANALGAWLERREELEGPSSDTEVDGSLWLEVVDAIKRDVAWAAVEDLLDARGFFWQLLGVYREGRWPCGWEGEYPAGRPVLL